MPITRMCQCGHFDNVHFVTPEGKAAEVKPGGSGACYDCDCGKFRDVVIFIQVSMVANSLGTLKAMALDSQSRVWLCTDVGYHTMKWRQCEGTFEFPYN